MLFLLFTSSIKVNILSGFLWVCGNRYSCGSFLKAKKCNTTFKKWGTCLECILFGVWLLSFSIVFEVHLCCLCICAWCLFVSVYYSAVWMCHNLSIHSLSMGIWIVSHLGLAFVWTCVFICHGQIPRSGTPGSRGKWILKFRVNCQTVYPECATFSSQQQYLRVPVPPHFHS